MPVKTTRPLKKRRQIEVFRPLSSFIGDTMTQTAPKGVFRSAGDNNPELGRDDIEPLGSVLADQNLFQPLALFRDLRFNDLLNTLETSGFLRKLPSSAQIFSRSGAKPDCRFSDARANSAYFQSMRRVPGELVESDRHFENRHSSSRVATRRSCDR